MSSTRVRGLVTAALLMTTTALVLALLVASGSAKAQTGSTTLQATVGPDPTITLTRDGAPVTSLEAGTYTIEVDDRADNHNFHLTGPGVDETTTVPEVATATWTVTLSEGTYTFVCDPHAQNMRGSFTVTGAAATPSEGLPLTGLDMVGVAWLGASLLTGGLAIAYFAGRHRPVREEG
jgi:plastocyanin